MNIILASGSPRRKDLLTRVGFRFTIIRPEVDESAKRGETPAQLVRRLANEKAEVVARKKASSVVIAADTIVVAPNGRKVLGKPSSRQEAVRMVKTLQGKTHTVLTGYSVWINGKRVQSRVVKTRVQMRRLGRAEVERYVRAGESMDKAGAYAAQGLGMTLIEKIGGSYTNVVGLPIAELVNDLSRLGVKPR